MGESYGMEFDRLYRAKAVSGSVGRDATSAPHSHTSLSLSLSSPFDSIPFSFNSIHIQIGIFARFRSLLYNPHPLLTLSKCLFFTIGCSAC